MNIKEVKKLVNTTTISDAAESTNLEGYFDEDVEILVTELVHEVWESKYNREMDQEAEDYLDKLQTVIRKEILNTIKTLKYKNLDI